MSGLSFDIKGVSCLISNAIDGVDELAYSSSEGCSFNVLVNVTPRAHINFVRGG